MATISKIETPSGKPRYRARIRLKGHPTVTKTFERKTDAKAWVVKAEDEIRAGEYLENRERELNTVGGMIDRYVRTVLPDKSESTQYSQSIHFEWWRNEIGRLTLNKLKPAVIAQCRDRLVESGRSASTANRYLAALSHCCSVAEREWHLLTSNPVKRVRRRPEPSGRVRFLSDTERKALLRETKASKSPFLHTIVLLALSTGMRHSEILTLRWPQVDLKRRVIVLEKTKNKERRAVPLVGEALESVRQLRATPRIDTDLLFPSHRDAKKPADTRVAWEAALERAGIKDFRFHDLRHTTASYLAMNGATTAELAAVLGHKTLQMVKRYSHLSEQHTVGVLERMNERIFQEDEADGAI